MDEKQVKEAYLEKIAESFGQFALEREEDKTRKRLATIGAIAGGGIGYALRHKPAEHLSSLRVRSHIPGAVGKLESLAAKSVLKPEIYAALKKISPALMVAGGLIGGNAISKGLYDFASD